MQARDLQRRLSRPFARLFAVAFVALTALAPGAAVAQEKADEKAKDNVAAPAFEKFKIAVLDVKTDKEEDAAFAQSIGQLAAARLAANGVFEVITSEDVRSMIELERTKSDLGCDDDTDCLAEIGAALGVPYLMSGTVARVGMTWLIGFTVVDIENSKPVARDTKTAEGKIEVLKEVEALIDRVVEPLVRTRVGTLTVEVSDPGATIEVDGRAIGVSPLESPMTLPPGYHRVVATKEGYLLWERDVDLKPLGSEQLDIVLRLVPKSEEALAREAVATALLWPGIGVVSLGVIAAAASTGVMLWALSVRRDPKSLGEDKTLVSVVGPVSVVGVFAASVIALTGGGLILGSVFAAGVE